MYFVDFFGAFSIYFLSLFVSCFFFIFFDFILFCQTSQSVMPPITFRWRRSEGERNGEKSDNGIGTLLKNSLGCSELENPNALFGIFVVLVLGSVENENRMLTRFY